MFWQVSHAERVASKNRLLYGGIKAVARKPPIDVDIWGVDEERISEIGLHLDKAVHKACREYHLTSTVELIAQSDVVHLDSDIIDVICEVAKRQKLPYQYMSSGAVHDAVMMTDVTKVGRVFIPSIAGRSHCPQEDTNLEDIHKGCNWLIETVYQLANQ